MSVIEKAKKELWKENSLSVSRLLSYPAPETILYELLRPYGFTRQVVSSLFASLDGESGKSFYSPSGWRVIKDRDCLLIGKSFFCCPVIYKCTYNIIPGTCLCCICGQSCSKTVFPLFRRHGCEVP